MWTIWTTGENHLQIWLNKATWTLTNSYGSTNNFHSSSRTSLAYKMFTYDPTKCLRCRQMDGSENDGTQSCFSLSKDNWWMPCKGLRLIMSSCPAFSNERMWEAGEQQLATKRILRRLGHSLFICVLAPGLLCFCLGVPYATPSPS